MIIDELNLLTDVLGTVRAFRVKGQKNPYENPINKILGAEFADWTVAEIRKEGRAYGMNMRVQDFLRRFEAGEYPDLEQA
jgi:hypothetical protein